MSTLSNQATRALDAEIVRKLLDGQTLNPSHFTDRAQVLRVTSMLEQKRRSIDVLLNQLKQIRV